MLERFIAHLQESKLWDPASTVLIGYSGGGDSTCLVHLAHRAGLKIIAAHLNHGVRPESRDELEKAAAWCEELGVPFVSGQADVPAMAAALKIGLEEAGRKARYEFFDQARLRLGADAIATAHTLDDHSETVLMNIARGCGLNGLGGIPVKRDRIIRPLLGFTRAETRAYCLENNLWFHDDPSNADDSFRRARVRLRVMPHLEAVNPEIRTALARLSKIASEDDACLDAMAASALEQAEIPVNGPLNFLTNDCEILLKRELIVALPLALRRRALRLVVQALGAEMDFELAQATALNLTSLTSGSMSAPLGEVVVEWNETEIHARQLLPSEPFRFPLTMPGETLADEFGWGLTAIPCNPDAMTTERRSLSVVIDHSSVKGPLYFRNAQNGEAIEPLGLNGHKKLTELMREASLTEAARKRLPIICDLVGPIWIPGITIADRVKIKPETQKALNLRLGPLTS